MLTEEDVRRLINQQAETKNLDYKEGCNWLATDNDKKCELIKDILAMANTQDGGQLVFGVDDRTFEFVGMDPTSYESFDPTKVNDFVRQYTDPPFACNVYKFCVDQRLTVVLEIPEFTEIPVICKTDANSNKAPHKTILKKSGMYVRTDKPSSELVSTSEVMRDIIGRASRKKREELLRTIRDLLEGRKTASDTSAVQAYAKELAGATEFFATTLPSDFGTQGHWQVVVHPTNYLKDRLNTHQALAERIRQSTVSLRGWNFPHTDATNVSNFVQGTQSETNFMHHVEAYRAYLSGLFCWKSAFWENERFRGKNILSFIGVIFQFTEFLEFVKRFYTGTPDAEAVNGEISMVNVRGLTLESMRIDVELFGSYTCRENLIQVPINITAAELQADSELIARRLAQRVFAVFNWTNATEQIIESWQDKLLTRTYY